MIVLNKGASQPLYLDFPQMYTVGYSSMTTGTFSFLSGTYTAGTEFSLGGPIYNINITPPLSGPSLT